MKKILFLFLFVFAAIEGMAQNYVFEYDVNFRFNNPGNRRRYDLGMFYNTKNNSGTREVYDFNMDDQEDERRVTGRLVIPASEGPINDIFINTDRQVKFVFWSDDCGNGSSVFLLQNNGSNNCFDLTNRNPNWGCLNYNGTISQYKLIMYAEATVSSPNNVDKILPTDDKINVQGSPGFPSDVYKWQYKVDTDINWQDLPSQFQNIQSINVSATDLLGSVPDNLIAKNIFIRLNLGCGKYSNPITLNIRKSAPHLTSIIPIPNTCFGEQNGSISLNFDRNLIPGELLNVVVADSLTGDVYLNLQNLSALEAGNKITTSSTLPPGKFKIDLIDKYNGNVAYTGATTHTGFTSFSGPTAVDFNIAKRDIYCYNGKDGTITVNASGGNGGYKVLYKKQQDANYNEMAFATAGQQIITALDTGSYQIRVMDQNGCYKKDAAGKEVISTATITQPAEALHVDYRQTTNPTAFGATDGNAQAIIVGGTPNAGNYNIQWTDMSGNVLSNYTNTTNPFKTVLNNVGDGKYILKITDSNYALAQTANAASCIVIDTFTLSQPKVLDVLIEKNKNVVCNGETNAELYAKGTGGIEIPGQKYTYQWFKDAGGTFSPISQTDSILINVGAGIYKVKITDKNNVSKESAPFTLTEPLALDFSSSKRDVYCYNGKDGTITVNATGGNAGYKLLYKRQEEVSYTEIAFATASQHILTALDVGTYTIRVTDLNGCYKKDATGAEVIQTITINQPAEALRIDHKDITNPIAFGTSDGRAEVTIVGGTPNAGNYNVQWTDINGNTLSNYTNTNNPFKTVLNNVADGKYILKITDNNYALAQSANASSCIVIDTITLKQPDPLKVAIEQYKYVSCNGDADGQLYAKATGGIIIPGQKYSYQWSKEINGTFSTISPTDSILTNVAAGIYKVKITDKNNISKESVPFTLTEPAPLAISLSSTQLICSGDTNGTATASITGGTQPYHIEWSNGDTTVNINQLTDGNYLAFVTDAHGCQVQAQVKVSSPNPLLISGDVVKQPTCFGSNDGAITQNISGGTPPYQYLWSNGATTANLSNLTAGTYTLTISESKGCSKSVTYILTEPAAVKVNLGPDITLCVDQVHEADATIPDGAIYKWTGSNGFTANTAKVALSTSGTYYVEATTTKGCIGRDTIEIKKSTAVITSEFVVTTQTFKNENVNLVNISSPAPQKVEWLVPDDKNISIVSKTNDVLQLKFAATGTYNISLKATVGDCFKIFTKQITVIEGTSFNDPGTVKDPFIKSFIIAPNPSNGNFYAKIELQESSKIKLRLLNTTTGQLIDTREESGSNSYNLPYYLTLSTGVYVMVLETPTQNMVYKVLIQ